MSGVWKNKFGIYDPKGVQRLVKLEASEVSGFKDLFKYLKEVSEFSEEEAKESNNLLRLLYNIQVRANSLYSDLGVLEELQKIKADLERNYEKYSKEEIKSKGIEIQKLAMRLRESASNIHEVIAEIGNDLGRVTQFLRIVENIHKSKTKLLKVTNTVAYTVEAYSKAFVQVFDGVLSTTREVDKNAEKLASLSRINPKVPMRKIIRTKKVVKPIKKYPVRNPLKIPLKLTLEQKAQRARV